MAKTGYRELPPQTDEYQRGFVAGIAVAAEIMQRFGNEAALTALRAVGPAAAERVLRDPVMRT